MSDTFDVDDVILNFDPAAAVIHTAQAHVGAARGKPEAAPHRRAN
jgi:hypothetical protein